MPEMNDDFAKQVGAFENLQALREAVKANLATQSRAQYDDDYFSRLMEKIKEGSVIKYPPQAVDHEVEHVMEDLKSRLAGQNLDMAAYLKSREMDEEKFITEEAKPIAVKRLERSLVMDAIAKAEKIEVSQDLLQSSFQTNLGGVPGRYWFPKNDARQIPASQATHERCCYGICQPGLRTTDAQPVKGHCHRPGPG